MPTTRQLTKPCVQGLWLLLLSLVVGCSSYERSYSFASPPKLIFKDTDFVYAALSEGRLAVGAVTQAGVEDYYAADPIARRLHEMISRQWPEFKILTAQDTERHSGKLKYQQMIRDFREDGVLKPEQVKTLQPLAEDARYLLLMDVREESDQSSRSFDSTTVNEVDFFTGKETGAEVTEYKVRKSSKRSMRALFIIYDLQTCQHVWIATVAGSSSFANGAKSHDDFPAVQEAAGATPAEVAAHLFTQVMPMLPRGGSGK